jgi:murein L,D-transpeptidase YafK
VGGSLDRCFLFRFSVIHTFSKRLALGLGISAALLSGAAAMYLGRSNSAASSPPERISLEDEAQLAASLAAGPEPMLADVFHDIEQGKHDLALRRVSKLVEAYPKFRLGHLIKGDLLLARTQPLTRFGQGGSKTAEDRVADLRAEAVVRLQGYRTKPPENFVPRYLTQMADGQKYALVVDTQKSRLYVYQNQQGTPRFVADYYVTQGKLGSDKFREGDKKTPIGVYHVTADLPRNKLADLYGSGAFPLNYPNEWDKRQGRGGSGIWLHGTMSDTFSRPPRASDGCVVLPNKDLDAIAGKLQVGLTPVIISESVEWLSLDDWHSERSALQKVIAEWRSDWESRDVDRYARHYSRKFEANEQDFDAWMDQKRRVNAGKEWIKIDTRNLSMLRNPGKDDYVVTTFDQDYQSNNLKNVMRKRQYWVKEDGRWKIIFEGSV